MTIELQQQVKDDGDVWFPTSELNKDLVFNALAMAGEVGEFCNLLKKSERGDFDLTPALIVDMAFELADVYIYLMQCANILNIDLDKVYEQKRELNVKRFDPMANTRPPKLDIVDGNGQPKS